jgi:hypothetical protein
MKFLLHLRAGCCARSTWALARARLQHVDLQGVDLQRVDLQRVDLQGVDLQHVGSQRAGIARFKLPRCNLKHGSLQRAWLLALLVVLGASMSASTPAHAAPMGFEGATMTMGDLGPNWGEIVVNYAITPRDALGGAVTHMRSDDGTLRRELAEVAYTRLLKRWNMPHAQANLWFLGGAGAVRADGETRLMLTPGVQADYETRRVYLSATGRLYRARGLNHDYGMARAGFSFYETGYDETQPWLVLEARRMRGLSQRPEVTPLLRFINKSYFVEAGVSNMHQARLNFMYIF